MMRTLGWMVGLSVVLSGCGWVRSQPAIEARSGAVQEGVASWYGPGFHGNATSSGEIYDQNDMTAAHQTLPLGTQVAVTNLDNGRQVEVRINDRGPFARGRVIDLSYAAARALEMVGPGTAAVRVEVLGARTSSLPRAAYAVQVGAFADRGNAERLQQSLAPRFDREVYVAVLDGEVGRHYRVRLGRFAHREDALRAARSMASLGFTPVIVEDGVAD